MDGSAAGFDPVRWVRRADQLDMKVSVRDHPAMPGCRVLCIGAPRGHRRDADALLKKLRPADHGQTRRNEQVLAEYLMGVGRYEESEPEILGSVHDHDEAAPRVVDAGHSDGISLTGLLSGAVLIGVAWLAALMLS